MANNDGHEADALPTGELRNDEVQLLRRIMHEYKLNRSDLHAVVAFVRQRQQWGWLKRQIWKVFAAVIGTITMLAALRNDIMGLVGWIFQRGP